MNASTQYEPLIGRLDGLLDEIFRPGYYAGRGRSEALPLRVDVKETAEAYVVTAEIPGVKKEDIHVEVEGNEVTIGAESRREAETKEGEKWLRVERSFGRTQRRFALPQELDDTKASAKFLDGVLELTLPKKAPAAGRKVEVH